VAALELGRHNIRVNSVNPTVVMTDMSAFYWGAPMSVRRSWSRCRWGGGPPRTKSPRRSASCSAATPR
jgi:NAD(P)-dependent dehydrogenase (short-subunit alcohol dehydrogenase family)